MSEEQSLHYPEIPTRIRKAHESDIPAIFSAIQKGLQSCFVNKLRGGVIDKNVYYALMQSFIPRLLKASNVLVLVSEEDEDVIYGFIVYKDRNLFYVYVKSTFQEMGMGRFLLDVAFGPNPLENIFVPWHLEALSFRFPIRSIHYYTYPLINVVKVATGKEDLVAEENPIID